MSFHNGEIKTFSDGRKVKGFVVCTLVLKIKNVVKFGF